MWSTRPGRNMDPHKDFCDHITRPRPLTIPFIIFMIAAAAPATGSLTSQTHKPLRNVGRARVSTIMITVTWLPLQKGGPRTVDLGRELPNFLNREINLWNEKEEGKRCTLTLGLRSFASHCLCAAHDQMFCSLLLEKGDTSDRLLWLVYSFLLSMHISLQVSLRTTHT